MRIWISIALLLTFMSCEKKWELSIYQHFYFNEGQQIELVINEGDFEKIKSFESGYSSDKYRSLGTYKADLDSMKIYFRLDKVDTVFTVSSDYTRKLVVGSNAYGQIIIGTDNDEGFWTNN